ncbi:hypothetical protein MATL_G00002750 [Megalops atlanticus]|uniref:Uncharacterized protein n=1 Tax=Megalops atlanticus TaxID=7932 RepID=A0A9D3QFJ9_MEGAT|nr:hypothetical protein MATL_G00002750 [Megalops atlanticus]
MGAPSGLLYLSGNPAPWSCHVRGRTGNSSDSAQGGQVERDRRTLTGQISSLRDREIPYGAITSATLNGLDQHWDRRRRFPSALNSLPLQDSDGLGIW